MVKMMMNMNDEHELHMINDAEGDEAYAIFSSSPS